MPNPLSRMLILFLYDATFECKTCLFDCTLYYQPFHTLREESFTGRWREDRTSQYLWSVTFGFRISPHKESFISVKNVPKRINRT